MFYDKDSSTSVERRPREFLPSNFGRHRLRYGFLSLRCKLARWTAQSILAGAEQMKLGYVSRVARTNPYDHVVLATQFYKPKEFATQITLNVNNMWGIIKMLVDLLLDKDDGKYVIARDGLKPLVRIYAVPPNTFEGDDSEDDDEVVQEEESESD